MSPIDKISDIRRLPRLGKIRLGIKKEGQKGPYPSATDYFVCPDEVKAVHGEQPREFPVMFPSDDLELVAPQWLKCYSYSQGLICKGDGKHCKRKVDTETGDFTNRDTKEWVLTDGICDPEHCPKIGDKQCRRMMSLLFILPEIPGLGVYQLDTSSFYSIVNLNSQLAPDGFLRHFTNGRIAFIPLILSVEPQEVTPPGVGRKTVHILNVRADVKLTDIIRISRQKPAQILLPTLEEEEPPYDLYPEEVLEHGEEAAAIAEKDLEALSKGGEGDASPPKKPKPKSAAAQPGHAKSSPVTTTMPDAAAEQAFTPPPAEPPELATDRQRILDSAEHMRWDQTKLAAYLKDRCKDKSAITVDKVPPELVRKLANELADWETMA